MFVSQLISGKDIIIEDLDRFECPEIFQKLREINFLLRQSEVLKQQKRRVRFIYAVKDDLFKDTERTKFFDYIASVIPVVNPKNSCEKLTHELEERGYSINKGILKDLSEFVDDMRMLKNVVNEFQQYVERLDGSSFLNKEKLLAMIIYKNHHPDDFGKLHYKDGAVYGFISKKGEWVKIVVDKVIVPRLESLGKRREELEASHVFTMKQWRRLYMTCYREHLSPSLATIVVQGKERTITEIADSEKLFEELIKQNKVLYTYRERYGSNSSNEKDLPFSLVEKEVDERMSYYEHKKKNDVQLEEIDNEIIMVREEERRLKNFKIVKLLTNFPEIKESAAFKTLSLSPLMIHFLQRGYIDETYYDYITLFDGTELSLNDRTLLALIKQNTAQDYYDSSIDDVETLINEIPIWGYEYRSVLNFQIADYLESHPIQCKDALASFEDHFLGAPMPPLDFLALYYKRGGNCAQTLWRKFVNSESSWLRIHGYEKKEFIDTLTEAWLKFCKISDINEPVRAWLNTNLGFCIERIGVLGVDHLKDIIQECKFVDISPLNQTERRSHGSDIMDLAQFILSNKLFELTNNNISVACAVSCDQLERPISIDEMTMSTILSSNNTGLKEYVEDNIRDVFTQCISRTKCQENEDGLIYILNQEELNEQEKIDYLRRQTQAKVFDIRDVNDPYKPLAIRSGVLYPMWGNVLDYYAADQMTISKDLEDFINDNVDPLSKDEYPIDGGATFASDLIFGAYLNITVYEMLLPCLIRHVRTTDESKLSIEIGKERIELLVNGNHLSNSIDTAKVVAQFGAVVYARYLSYHISSLLDDYNDYEVDTRTLSLLIGKESLLTIGRRWTLANKVTVDLVRQDRLLADSLISVMLKRKKELSWGIVNAALENASPTNNKLHFQVWLLKMHYANADKVVSIIETMTPPYCDIVDDSKRPLVPMEFQECLDLLKPLGLFSSYKEEKKGLRVFHSSK